MTLIAPNFAYMRKSVERVLLVEDEVTFRRIIARNLSSRGLTVREAGSVAEAASVLNTELPDLMLLDINLPDRTGWDLLRDLRLRGKEVPTIVVSAVRVSQGRLDEFHPMAYLPKPFPLEALLRLIFENHDPRGAASDDESSDSPSQLAVGDDVHVDVPGKSQQLLHN